MTLYVEANGSGWIQCDWCSEPSGIDPAPSTWKVNVDEIDHRGPVVSCGRQSCRFWRGSKQRWVGARAVVAHPEKYGIEVDDGE